MNTQRDVAAVTWRDIRLRSSSFNLDPGMRQMRQWDTFCASQMSHFLPDVSV